MADSVALLASFFPPVLTPSYLLALMPLVLETIGLTLGAMFIAFCVSLPLGIAAGLLLPGTRPLLAVLTALRSIPDLTLAILCVIVFGIGPGAGLVALALYYSAAVAKIFAEVLRTAPQAPLRALQASGASRLQIALFGLLPMKRADLLSFGAYEFECALRASTVIGAVGGGGLGGELLGSLAAMDFPRVTTQLIVLVIVVAALDQCSLHLRRRPRGLLLLTPLGAYAAIHYSPQLLGAAHAARVFAEMLPPQLSTEQFGALARQLRETICMGVAGTLGGALIAMPASIVMARNLTPVWLAWPLRRVMEIARCIPEVAWGLILIAIIGIGPMAGAVALGLHSAGCLARLFAEALENAPRAPQDAMSGIGASPLAVAAYATLPLASGPIAVYSLFRLEWNLRMATVVGVIGAGGIGQALYEAQQLFFYHQMFAYILITATLCFVVDHIGDALRRRFDVQVLPGC